VLTLLPYFERLYLDPDGQHRSTYDASQIDQILAEAAHLLRHLGFVAAHTVLIGGVVPNLLVLDPPREPHIGTTDLDLCLSVAIVDGDTGQYERIEASLSAAGYIMTSETFRWRQPEGLRLIVEFFCPDGEGRTVGRLYRPKSSESPVAKHNFGSHLSALVLSEGGVLTTDVISVQREIELPNGEGRTRFAFRVTGPLGFLVAKTAALTGRDKPKDAYDIVWLIENWDGGPAGFADALRSRPTYDSAASREALSRLFEEFSRPNGLGPSSYARFMTEEDTTREVRSRLALQAVGAVHELRNALGF
jgi:hypothetical protein